MTRLKVVTFWSHQMDEYHSHNTRRLNKEEMIQLLLKVDYVREQLDKMGIKY